MASVIRVVREIRGPFLLVPAEGRAEKSGVDPSTSLRARPEPVEGTVSVDERGILGGRWRDSRGRLGSRPRSSRGPALRGSFRAERPPPTAGPTSCRTGRGRRCRPRRAGCRSRASMRAAYMPTAAAPSACTRSRRKRRLPMFTSMSRVTSRWPAADVTVRCSTRPSGVMILSTSTPSHACRYEQVFPRHFV